MSNCCFELALPCSQESRLSRFYDVDSTFPFGELITDLHDLIINYYLDPLARFLLAFTSKSYFQRLKFPQKMNFFDFEIFLRKSIGTHGSSRQLIWFQQNRWAESIVFEKVVHEAVKSGNVSLLSQFRWEKETSFKDPSGRVRNELALRCTLNQGDSLRYPMFSLSGHIGCSGSMWSLHYFLQLGLKFCWSTFLDGALVGGNLSFVKEPFDGIFAQANSLSCFRYAALCGNEEVLHFVARSKQITFTDPPGVGEVFFDIKDLLGHRFNDPTIFKDVIFDPTTHDGRFLKLLTFLHGRGIKFSSDLSLAEKVLDHVIYYDLSECAVYLERSEQMLSGSVLSRGYFASTIGSFAFAFGSRGIRSPISTFCKVIRSYLNRFIALDELNNFFEAALVCQFTESLVEIRGDPFFELVELLVHPDMKIYPLPHLMLKTELHNDPFPKSPEYAYFMERLLQHRICIPFYIMKHLVKVCSDASVLHRMLKLFIPLYHLGQQLGLISADRSEKKTLDLFEAALSRPHDDLIPLFNLLLALGHTPFDLGHLFGCILIRIGKKMLTLKKAEEVANFFDLPRVLTQANIDNAFFYVSSENIAFILRMNCRFTSDAYGHLFTEYAPIKSPDEFSIYLRWKLDCLKEGIVAIPSNVVERLLTIIKHNEWVRPFRRVHAGHLLLAVKILEDYGMERREMQELRLLADEINGEASMTANEWIYSKYLNRPELGGR